jgi:hypothetical protein
VILAVNEQCGRNHDSFLAVVQMMWTMFAEIYGKVATHLPLRVTGGSSEKG